MTGRPINELMNKKGDCRVAPGMALPGSAKYMVHSEMCTLYNVKCTISNVQCVHIALRCILTWYTSQ